VEPVANEAPACRGQDLGALIVLVLLGRFSFAVKEKIHGYAGFEVRNGDGAFVGPWGVMLHFPELAQPLGRFGNLAQQLPGLPERARQVVVLTIGARFNVAYEMYAHAKIAVQLGGLEPRVTSPSQPNGGLSCRWLLSPKSS